MNRIDEIARYSTAEQLFQTGMDYLEGKNGKFELLEYAVKYLKAAADKGHKEAIFELKRMKMTGIEINDDEL